LEYTNNVTTSTAVRGGAYNSKYTASFRAARTSNSSISQRDFRTTLY